MRASDIHHFKSINDYFRYRDLPRPAHPLITIINLDELSTTYTSEELTVSFGFYAVSLKRMHDSKIRYGQSSYDFDEGIMFFFAPGQVFSIHVPKNPAHQPSGWILLLHPDFLWGYGLAKKMGRFEYFGYAANEALHLSPGEQRIVEDLLSNIRAEYLGNMDKFSQDLMVTQIESLLTYADRFYQRQFITRRVPHHAILERFEEIIAASVTPERLSGNGLPTVQSLARELSLSPNYLSSLLKTLTGRSTQQHIQDKIIAMAKEKLSTTNLTVSEIAYELGFEHSQSFNKMFRQHTRSSPLEFRASFS